MHKNGLVSVSFRHLAPEEIIKAALDAGLSCIEWGSDIHAPCDDLDKLQYIASLQLQYGVSCCSYGTYFRLGDTPLSQLQAYISAAKVLGTNILRLWCGNKKCDDYTADEKEALFSQCRQAAAIAQRSGVTLCMECHIKSFTETADGALELMLAVNSPYFQMYWQPNQFRTMEENTQYAQALQPYITHIHVFQWKERNRYPLVTGIDEWQTYLSAIGGDHTLLLEFMPDDDIRSLTAEAEALKSLTGEYV